MHHPANTKPIQKALAFLRTQQHSDGSFFSYSSSQPYEFQNNFTYKTTFANSIILRCLSNVDSFRLVSDPLARYLQSQMQENGAYNYWDNTSREFTQLPYPNDLDDTFCAMSALALHNPAAITGAHMARATVILTRAESQPGGPYFTWLDNTLGHTWEDIDVVVNANVLYFLRGQHIKQPKLQSFIDEAIRTKQFYSPYYPSQLHALYFLCFATNNHRPELILYIKQLLRLHQPRSALECALLVVLLERTALLKEAAIYRRKLLSQQLTDGSWPAAAFCVDPTRNGKKHFSGSSALTTAFALQALTYRKENAKEQRKGPSLLVQRAAKIATQQISDTDTLLQKDLGNHIRHIAEGTYAHEIIASPYLFYKSLAHRRSTLPKNFLESVSTANTFGWIAYTIYDDFIDEEGIPELLPTANVAHRKSLINFFQAVSYKQDFREYIIKTFNTIDAANKWELQNCRPAVQQTSIEITHLPDFGDRSKLAEKSLGHTLPFLLVSLYCDTNLTDKRFARLESALKHYLIARQLHDDVHDWQQDLTKGHISYVIATILAHQNITEGILETSDLLAKVQDSYWRTTLPFICTIIDTHLKAARTELLAIGYDSTSLGSLITSLENATAKTMSQQKDTLLFLDTYRTLTQY